MSGIRPQQPEVVSYHKYEQMRDSGLPPVSLYPKKRYTARLMNRNPTVEKYAFDVPSVVLKINHFATYSIINFRFNSGNRTVTEVEGGVNLGGIMFNHEPLPEDLEFIPHSAEVGYFVGPIEGNRGRGEIPVQDEEETEREESLVELGQLALTV